MTVSPADLAILLEEDLYTAKAVIAIKAATAVVSAVARQDLPDEVAEAAVLGLAGRVYRNPGNLADWEQAQELVLAEMASSPAIAQALREPAPPTVPTALPLLLGKLTPEAKRELAAQLLRAANTDEGYHDDTASERIDG